MEEGTHSNAAINEGPSAASVVLGALSLHARRHDEGEGKEEQSREGASHLANYAAVETCECIEGQNASRGHLPGHPYNLRRSRCLRPTS